MTTKLTKQGLIALTIELTKHMLCYQGDAPTEVIQDYVERIEEVLSTPGNVKITGTKLSDYLGGMN